MNASVITVQNLGKRYSLRQQARSGLLRDRLASLLRHPLRELRAARATAEEFWALQDVNFSVRQGEVLGIIGRNGAGKSTLLKILSRITEPTTGRIAIEGRVASLLEVGTGFHGELSGRENIFLNGAILGMNRAEIRKKFDEIVAFAEVEKFLDTPVKYYSSGMYVRLAFAVAAHLEPEILIVDEVLAVGDADFQRKCLGKMNAIAHDRGRTVLFVSHNLASVRQLCSRALLLDRGQLLEQGPVDAVLSRYASGCAQKSEPTATYKHIRGDGRARITRLSFGAKESAEPLFAVFSPLSITLHYTFAETPEPLDFFLLFYDDNGDCLLSSFQSDSGTITHPQQKTGSVTATFQNPFLPGHYLVSAGLFDRSRQFLDWVEFAEGFRVEAAFASGKNFDQRLGRMSIKPEWQG